MTFSLLNAGQCIIVVTALPLLPRLFNVDGRDIQTPPGQFVYQIPLAESCFASNFIQQLCCMHPVRNCSCCTNEFICYSLYFYRSKHFSVLACLPECIVILWGFVLAKEQFAAGALVVKFYKVNNAVGQHRIWH